MAERRPPGFNVDLGFYDSDEVLSIPRKIRAAAIGVWTLCGSYSANKLTDGYVSAEALRDRGCTPAIRAALIASTLWESADVDAIRFTRWAKWQRTCAEVKAYRESEAERKRKAREAKRAATTSDDAEVSGRTTAGQPQPVRPEDGDPKTKTETETELSTSSVTLVGGSGGKAVADAPAGATKGTRLPDDWVPTDKTIATMREQFPHVDLAAIHEEFADYWRSVPGSRGRKLDWEATYRNRVREVAGRQRPRAVNGHSMATSDLRVAQTQALKIVSPQRLELE